MAKLQSAKDYFEEVVRPNYNDFMGHPSTFQRVVNMVNSLFHLHEWIYAFDKARAELLIGGLLGKPYDLWSHVEARVPEAGFVRDLANASKHVSINRNTSTTMTHIANTEIVSYGWGQGGWGAGRFGGAPSTMIEEGAGTVSLDDCARKVFTFWENFVVQL